MDVIDTAIDGVQIVRLDVFEDDRGAFAETFDSQKFRTLGIPGHFVQDSWSLSKRRGTVRGLHFQLPPHAQHKIVRVTRGRVLDVVVDIRQGSPHFGHHLAIELSAAQPVSLFVPIGFAHGFCTLEDDTELTYKMSDHFFPDLYRGICWADPRLDIRWPVTAETALLSARDRAHPSLDGIDNAFVYHAPSGATPEAPSSSEP